MRKYKMDNEIQGVYEVRTGGVGFCTLSVEGKLVDLKFTDKVKEAHPTGLTWKKKYYCIFNQETKLLVYAKIQGSNNTSVAKAEETKKKKERDLTKVFDTLNSIKCNVEKKGRFNYVSWTDAWSEVMKVYPAATFRVYENSEGFPAFIHPTAGAFVKVGVTIEGVEHIEHYPVTDYANKSLVGDKIDTFAINTAIKRAMVKSMAYFGLGLYIYKGEDLPEESD